MRTWTYAVVGGIILGLIGLMVGSGNAYYTKKSQQEEQRSVEMPLWTIVGGVAGLVLGGMAGNAMDEDEKKKQEEEKSTKLAREEASTRQAEPKRMEAVGREEERKHEDLLSTLGFNDAVTTYEGTGNKMTGVTKWTDRRNNKEYEVKSQVEEEINYGGGSRKFKTYWINTYVNRVKYMSASKHNHKYQGKTKEAFFKEMHMLWVDNFFREMKNMLAGNPTLTLDEAFVKLTKREAAHARHSAELYRLESSGDLAAYEALKNRPWPEE
jgi:hypothetical protein